jgi:DNA-binding transcriptional LysR family regulator
VRDDLNLLAMFLAVAEEHSFTRAARRLGVSPSAISHAMRTLEERIGVRLLSRTTRSVAPTEAGRQLLARLTPAIGDIRQGIDEITGLREKPAGRLRIVVSPLAGALVLAPRLNQFVDRYPEVTLDVATTLESRIDLVAGGFDAGIRLGEYLERDMVAVRVSRDQCAAIVASPAYFEKYGRPKSPRDLPKHRCLNFRHGPRGEYRWEFDKGRQSLAVAVRGQVVFDDVELMLRAAIGGAGLVFTLEGHAAPHLDAGSLERVLEDWCPPFPGYFLYYPSRRQQPAALTALIETFRL